MRRQRWLRRRRRLQQQLRWTTAGGYDCGGFNSGKDNCCDDNCRRWHVQGRFLIDSVRRDSKQSRAHPFWPHGGRSTRECTLRRRGTPSCTLVYEHRALNESIPYHSYQRQGNQEHFMAETHCGQRCPSETCEIHDTLLLSDALRRDVGGYVHHSMLQAENPCGKTCHSKIRCPTSAPKACPRYARRTPFTCTLLEGAGCFGTRQTSSLKLSGFTTLPRLQELRPHPCASPASRRRRGLFPDYRSHSRSGSLHPLMFVRVWAEMPVWGRQLPSHSRLLSLIRKLFREDLAPHIGALLFRGDRCGPAVPRSFPRLGSLS